MDKIQKNELAAAVYQIARLIPSGRATSYGAIAKAVGLPNHSRLIGRLMHGCPDDVPAHRVVNGQGVLTARAAFGPPNCMRVSLEEEGITIRNNRIVNWKNVFWNPIDEL